MSLTTLFSLTRAAVVRLLAGSASYPCLFVGLRQCPLAATYPAPGSYPFLWLRRLSSSAFLDSRPREFSSRFQILGRPLCDVWRRSAPVYSGLHTTPEFIATQSVLTACLPASGPQLTD